MANPAPGSAPANVSFPLGFIGYQLAGMAAGGSEVLSVLSEPGVLWNTLYRFGSTPGAEPPVLQPFLWDGKTGGRIFADEIAVGLIDGQRGDSDLAANGRIIDVLGPGFSPRPWQNPLLWPDVNNDGDVTPADVLALINEINAGRSGTLPLVPQGDRGLPPFWDVNGDGNLTANDVLDVINYLNARVGASESDEGGEGESLAATPVLPAADAPRSMPPAALVEIAVPARRLPAPATNLAAWPQAVDSALATLVRPAVTTAVPVAGSASPARSAPAGDASLALERALSEIADEIALLR
jgi:hypothetical protein